MLGCARGDVRAMEGDPAADGKAPGLERTNSGASPACADDTPAEDGGEPLEADPFAEEARVPRARRAPGDRRLAKWSLRLSALNLQGGVRCTVSLCLSISLYLYIY